jgi:hypothetical protein
MSYLFIKNLFQREKFVIIFIKNLKIKKTKKTFVVGFLGGFFGWVFYCQPCKLPKLPKTKLIALKRSDLRIRD